MRSLEYKVRVAKIVPSQRAMEESSLTQVVSVPMRETHAPLRHVQDVVEM